INIEILIDQGVKNESCLINRHQSHNKKLCILDYHVKFLSDCVYIIRMDLKNFILEKFGIRKKQKHPQNSP
ncbi:MAG TPA: hypothetical protein VIY98_12125, partial [Nitrososphaeraceae archaeon]